MSLLFVTSPRVSLITSRIAHAVLARRRLLHQIAYALHDGTRPRSIPDDALRRPPNFVQSRWVEAKPAERRLGVGEGRGDRLVHFISDRRGKFPQRRNP